MIWGGGRAILIVGGLLVSNMTTFADDLHPADLVLKSGNSLTLESSFRTRFGWTEIAQRGSRPKAWDETVSPEARVSLKVLSGLFEGKLELGAVTDQFAHFDSSTNYSLRSDLQLGVNLGDWSIAGEWKGRDVFAYDNGDFLVGLNVYDLRVKRRFSSRMFAGLPPGQFQLSIAGGYGASIPSLFQRDFAECELEALQPLGNGFAVIIAPKLELSDYIDFAGQDRKDATLSLRVVPSYTFGGGVTLSVEGQTTVAFSTLAAKSGESWGVTPILRLQQAF